MDLIADILLAAGALGVGVYCFVLGRRLKKFNDLEKGVGGAVAAMSIQVNDMTKAMEKTQEIGLKSEESLLQVSGRAEELAQRLELLIASLHDLPNPERGETPSASAREPVTPTQPASEFETPLFVRHTST